ncbi:MAG: class I SAM-dependent methyltransferase [Candidatus Cloacimonetes bacterium]|jgi:SAM-dependent methyltransferase|nr:class I SAM-dependent methyltransferase [Candidatus Cloacimonadota bacterium]
MEALTYAKRAKFYEYEYDETCDHDFLLSYVTDNVKTILEIPCGSGRNIIRLSDTGKKIVGIDLEPAMIEALKKRISNSSNYKNTILMQGDITDFSFDSAFDLIIIPKEAFQMFLSREFQSKALINLNRHLKQNGKLIIDLANFIKGKNEDQDIQPSYFNPNALENELVKDFSKLLPSGQKLIRYHKQIIKEGTVLIDYLYKFYDRNNQFLNSSRSSVTLKQFSYGEMVSLIEESGLSIDHVYGNYRKILYSNHSVRMIFLLSKT